MSNKSRSTFQGALTTTINDNTNGEISEADVRGEFTNLSDSSVSRLDDAYNKYLGVTSGTSTAYTITSTADYPSSYNANMPFIFKLDQDNGASPTLNINSIGALGIYDDLQNQITTAGQLTQNSYYIAIYSADADGAATAGIVLISKLTFSSATSSNVTRSNAGTLTLSSAGKYVFFGTTSTWTLPEGSSATLGKEFKIANDGSGNITLQGDGSDTISGSDPFIIYPGTRYTAYWDGTTWILE